MNKTLIAVLVLGAGISACDAAPSSDAANSAANEPVGAEGRAEAVAGDEVVYVDVRTPEEFAAGHVAGAINIPHTEMRERHEELEPYADRQLVLYCQSGRRSGIAKEILEEEGFTDLVNGGGFEDLRAQGVPTAQ